MDIDEAKDKANKQFKAGKEKVNSFMEEHGVKEKLTAGKDKVNTKIKGLPFREMLEKKVSSETRAKFPVLDKLIPLTNYIVCGLVLVILVSVVRNAAGGIPNSASDFSYRATSDGNGITITKFNGTDRTVVIPARIEGKPVLRISDGAFSATGTTMSNALSNTFSDIFGVGGSSSNRPESRVVSVVVPASVKYIGTETFKDCQYLKSVTIQGTGVTISQRIFSGCDELKTFRFPGGANALIPDPGYTSISLFGTGDLMALLSGEMFYGNSGKKLPLATRKRLEAMGFSL